MAIEGEDRKMRELGRKSSDRHQGISPGSIEIELTDRYLGRVDYCCCPGDNE